jgi:hypothetical protein
VGWIGVPVKERGPQQAVRVGCRRAMAIDVIGVTGKQCDEFQ